MVLGFLVKSSPAPGIWSDLALPVLLGRHQLLQQFGDPSRSKWAVSRHLLTPSDGCALAKHQLRMFVLLLFSRSSPDLEAIVTIPFQPVSTD